MTVFPLPAARAEPDEEHRPADRRPCRFGAGFVRRGPALRRRPARRVDTGDPRLRCGVRLAQRVGRRRADPHLPLEPDHQLRPGGLRHRRARCSTCCSRRCGLELLAGGRCVGRRRGRAELDGRGVHRPPVLAVTPARPHRRDHRAGSEPRRADASHAALLGLHPRPRGSDRGVGGAAPVRARDPLQRLDHRLAPHRHGRQLRGRALRRHRRHDRGDRLPALLPGRGGRPWRVREQRPGRAARHPRLDLSSIVWIVSGSLAAVAGILNGMVSASSVFSAAGQTAGGLSAAIGITTLLRALAAAVVARMENVPLAVAAAIGIAMFEQAVFRATLQQRLRRTSSSVGDRRRAARPAVEAGRSRGRDQRPGRRPRRSAAIPLELAHAPAGQAPACAAPRGCWRSSCACTRGSCRRRRPTSAALRDLRHRRRLARRPHRLGRADQPRPVRLRRRRRRGRRRAQHQRRAAVPRRRSSVGVAGGRGSSRSASASPRCASRACSSRSRRWRSRSRSRTWSRLGASTGCPTQVTRPEFLCSTRTPTSAPSTTSASPALALAVFVAQGSGARRTGRLLIAMRDNERAAQAFGINLVRTRLATFAISGALAGFAGVLYAYHQNGVAAESFGPEQSIQMFLMAVIGGLGSVYAVLLGAIYLGTVDASSSTTARGQLLAGGVRRADHPAVLPARARRAACSGRATRGCAGSRCATGSSCRASWATASSRARRHGSRLRRAHRRRTGRSPERLPARLVDRREPARASSRSCGGTDDRRPRDPPAPTSGNGARPAPAAPAPQPERRGVRELLHEYRPSVDHRRRVRSAPLLVLAGLNAADELDRVAFGRPAPGDPRLLRRHPRHDPHRRRRSPASSRSCSRVPIGFLADR